jgi:hypothetical protein
VPTAAVPPPKPPLTEEERQALLKIEQEQREWEHAEWLKEEARNKARRIRRAVRQRLVRLLAKIDYGVSDDPYHPLSMVDATEHARKIVIAANNIIDAGTTLEVWSRGTVLHLGGSATDTIAALLYAGLRQEVTRNVRDWLMANGIPEDFVFTAFDEYEEYDPNNFEYDRYGPEEDEDDEEEDEKD